MGLIKEPINVDFSKKSEPWTEKELADFRKLMQVIKAKNTSQKNEHHNLIIGLNNRSDRSTHVQTLSTL